MPVDVLDQLMLGVSRPGNKDGAGVGDRFGRGMEKGLVRLRMAAAD